MFRAHADMEMVSVLEAHVVPRHVQEDALVKIAGHHLPQLHVVVLLKRS